MKVYISQPMRGKSDEEIKTEGVKVMKDIKEKFGYSDFLKTLFDDAKEKRPLEALGAAIQLMADADIVCFCKGWQEYRGCRIEHQCAQEYCKIIVYEV